MATYSARVYFTVLEFEADNAKQAEDKLNQLYDELADAPTDLSWDDLDWTLTEENN